MDQVKYTSGYRKRIPLAATVNINEVSEWLRANNYRFSLIPFLATQTHYVDNVMTSFLFYVELYTEESVVATKLAWGTLR